MNVREEDDEGIQFRVEEKRGEEDGENEKKKKWRREEDEVRKMERGRYVWYGMVSWSDRFLTASPGVLI